MAGKTNSSTQTNQKVKTNSPNNFFMIFVFIIIYLISGVLLMYVNKLIDQYLFKFNPEDNEKNNSMVLYLKVLIEIVILIIIFAIYLYIIKQIAISLKINDYNFMTSFISFIFFVIIILNLFKPYIFKNNQPTNNNTTLNNMDNINMDNVSSEENISESNLSTRLFIAVKIILKPKVEKPNISKEIVEDTNNQISNNMKSWKAINNREYIFDRDTKNHLDDMLLEDKLRNNKIKEDESINNLDVPFHKRHHVYRDTKSRDNKYSFRNSYPDNMFPSKENVYFEDS